jgi:fumarate hydratase class II
MKFWPARWLTSLWSKPSGRRWTSANMNVNEVLANRLWRFWAAVWRLCKGASD